MDERGIISIRGVSKRFGSVQAVDNVDLDIERGEFFSVLGPSGCGKTTVLRMLAGFESPTEGEIYIDGQAMSAIPPHQRPVNMVFQNYAIFPHLNVRKNIAFGLRKLGLSRTEVDAKVEEMLDLIELSGYADRAPTELSGGERQRVALARALIKRPTVLLLDEPLGALDKKLREQMQLELRALQKSVGITFVFVTHDQEEALTLSDRIAVMAMGKVLQVATPTGLYEQPNCRFVADFIGTMNFFDGCLRSADNGTAIVDAGPLGTIEVAINGLDHAIGDDIMVAIRPEKLALCLESPGDGTNVVQARMGPAAYLGDRSHYHVFLEGREQPVAVAVQNVAGPSAESLSADQPVWLSFSSKSVVLLEPE
ncbi:MAG: ABC transporter ATP-binding protein [Gammaproteobacteria bacterium]|nr:ABC transporter ATP-binding protein [Gammaproteobacteria bacterium]